MKNLRLLLLPLSLLLVNCGGSQIRFDPDFARGDFQRGGLVRENGSFISCTDPVINDEFSMRSSKVEELLDILQNINGLTKEQRNYIEEIKRDLRSNEKKQWVDSAQGESQRWILRLRNMVRENKERNRALGLEPR